MSSPFDAMKAALSHDVMAVFGESEAVTLRPRTRSEYAEGADTSRPARPIRGVFTEAQDTAALRGAAMSSEHSGVTRLSVQMAEFWLPASEVASLPYAIRQGDKVEFAGRPGRPIYSVSDMQKAEVGDLNLILVVGE
jgi:hypothetical protein